MRLRGVLLILAALLIAGSTAFIVRGWLQAQRDAMTVVPKEAPPPAATHVLVAKVDLNVGQFVRPEHLRWQAWPEGSLSPAYVVQGKRPMDEFVGGVVRNRIAGGEPVTEGRVVIPSNSGFMAAVLPPGMRAISVPVNATSGISGFVFPGDRVDLVLTHNLQQEQSGGTQERKASVTLLRDLRVLAIDQKIESKPGEAVVARTATLEVTSKQSEIVAVALEMGKLSLSLRSLAREDQVAGGQAIDASVAVAAGANSSATSETAAINGRNALIATAESRGLASSYTLDSDASGLLPPPFMAKSEITVFRGGKGDKK